MSIDSAMARIERGEGSDGDIALLRLASELEREHEQAREDSQKIVNAPWWAHVLGWAVPIAIFVSVPFLAAPADALRSPAHETPEDRGAPICVCDTQGRAICHFPEDGVQQILPRKMCAGKNPGDDPLAESTR